MIGDHLEKLIWDENDFEQMAWHDSKIYAIAFDEEQFELAFDIDFITKWINPSEKETYYKFWIAPVTLVFRNVRNINIDLDSVSFQIQNIDRSNPIKPKNLNGISDKFEYDWVIETTNGEISFKSVGYKQYFRKVPILLESQRIAFKDRGGISFQTTTPTEIL